MNYMPALVQLPLVREAGTRRIRSPEDAMLVCADVAALAQESLHVLTIDAKNHLINRHMVSLGGTDSSLAPAKEIFRAAISDGATGIVLVHNHPSGDPTPSTEDVQITRRLVEAGKVVEVRVMDHVIVGRKDGRPSRLSIREAGLCEF